MAPEFCLSSTRAFLPGQLGALLAAPGGVSRLLAVWRVLALVHAAPPLGGPGDELLPGDSGPPGELLDEVDEGVPVGPDFGLGLFSADSRRGFAFDGGGFEVGVHAEVFGFDHFRKIKSDNLTNIVARKKCLLRLGEVGWRVKVSKVFFYHRKLDWEFAL